VEIDTDYVVGTGSSGAVLANRLSADSKIDGEIAADLIRSA
jgi:hypothetical protein